MRILDIMRIRDKAKAGAKHCVRHDYHAQEVRQETLQVLAEVAITLKELKGELDPRRLTRDDIVKLAKSMDQYAERKECNRGLREEAAALHGEIKHELYRACYCVNERSCDRKTRLLQQAHSLLGRLRHAL